MTGRANWSSLLAAQCSSHVGEHRVAISLSQNLRHRTAIRSPPRTTTKTGCSTSTCADTKPPLDILPTPYHDALNGAKNALYKNRGKLRFENYTRSTGLDVDNGRFSFAATWIDYDDDGDQDLYVANDFGRNNLFMNEEGRFVDVAGEAGVEDMAAGMGISWSDYEADGDMDLYVSNMFSSAGNRIAYQRQFQVDSTEDTRSAFQRHARGNSLFANQGDGSFLDATESSGTWMGRWAWGAQFVDFDNDGREDIFVPNGFMTNERTNDL